MKSLEDFKKEVEQFKNSNYNDLSIMKNQDNEPIIIRGFEAVISNIEELQKESKKTIPSIDLSKDSNKKAIFRKQLLNLSVGFGEYSKYIKEDYYAINQDENIIHLSGIYYKRFVQFQQRIVEEYDL